MCLFCFVHFMKQKTKWTVIEVIKSAFYLVKSPYSLFYKSWLNFSQVVKDFGVSTRLSEVPVIYTPLYSFRKYIWKRYWLYFEGQKLTEDKKQLKE